MQLNTLCGTSMGVRGLLNLYHWKMERSTYNSFGLIWFVAHENLWLDPKFNIFIMYTVHSFAFYRLVDTSQRSYWICYDAIIITYSQKFRNFGIPELQSLKCVMNLCKLCCEWLTTSELVTDWQWDWEDESQNQMASTGNDCSKATATEVFHWYTSLNLLHLHFPKYPQKIPEKFRHFGNDKTPEIPRFRNCHHYL